VYNFISRELPVKLRISLDEFVILKQKLRELLQKGGDEAVFIYETMHDKGAINYVAAPIEVIFITLIRKLNVSTYYDIRRYVLNITTCKNATLLDLCVNDVKVVVDYLGAHKLSGRYWSHAPYVFPTSAAL